MHQAQSLSDQLVAYLEERRRIQQANAVGRRLVSPGYWGLHGKLAEALADDLVNAGFGRDAIVIDGRVRFPGTYGFGPRQWDLVVLDDDLPLVVVEIQAELGQTSKNLRNRMNDLLGITTNIARMFDSRERAPFRPCVAVVFVMMEPAGATPHRSLPANLYYVGDEQPGQKTWVDLMGTTLSRMLQDGVFDAGFFLTVNEPDAQTSEPFPELSFDAFVTRILDRISSLSGPRTGTSLGAEDLGRAFSHGSHVKEIVSGITSTPEGLSAAEGAVVRERRRVVANLLVLARDVDTTETMMHEAIGSKYWIFGGQYVGIADRRTIAPLDQHDIPLICADGSLEIVELKGPGAGLVRKYRNHLIVANEVHEAVNQCLNYLRTLDELGAALRTHYRNESGLDFDLRRARGTVILGHPDRSSSVKATREQIDQTLRSYNAHLSRLRVLTYADLLESAERALQFAAEESAGAPDR